MCLNNSLIPGINSLLPIIIWMIECKYKFCVGNSPEYFEAVKVDQYRHVIVDGIWPFSECNFPCVWKALYITHAPPTDWSCEIGLRNL